MKKIVAVITLLLAFTISANAQDEKTAQDRKTKIEVAAKDDAVSLGKYLGLTDQQVTDFIALFKMKHEILMDPTISDARKEEMRRVVGHKISATIDGNQQEKLAANPELLKKITN